MSRSGPLLLASFLFSLVVPAIGYYYVGWLVALLFLVGYLGGFSLWLLIPRKLSWNYLRTPYWTALVIFILLHKVEENRMKFFEVLGEKITGVAVPEMTPFLVIGLLVIPIGAWLAIPILIKRNREFGYYLAWTYFFSFGIVELAHFVFPFMTNEPYGYFPGMATAPIISIAGMWGMWRLTHKRFQKFDYSS